MNMKFIKAETNGNDFIILEMSDISSINIVKIADRRKGIGADQIIFFKPNKENMYEVKFFNNDGSEARMCGNGLCALSCVLAKDVLYLTGNEISEGHINPNSGTASVTLPLPKEISRGKNYKIIDTGNKHIVCLTRSDKFLEKTDEFNIHFIECFEQTSIKIETYERGAGKTPACGSGAIAAAFAYGSLCQLNTIYHEGGTSIVGFSKDSAFLSAKPHIIFEGEI